MVNFGPSCPSYTFVASVEDPDLGDTIYWRQFIDYQKNLATSDADPRYQTVPPPPASQTRNSLINFTIQSTDVRFGPNPGLTGEPHFVELFVADRPFYTDARAPIGQAIQDPDGLTDNVIWTVVFTQQTLQGCTGGG